MREEMRISVSTSRRVSRSSPWPPRSAIIVANASVITSGLSTSCAAIAAKRSSFAASHLGVLELGLELLDARRQARDVTLEHRPRLGLPEIHAPRGARPVLPGSVLVRSLRLIHVGFLVSVARTHRNPFGWGECSGFLTATAIMAAGPMFAMRT